ncbi:MAG: hypothetical protein KF868_02550 [Acidobacteria bacterium]|nr:hypothetical protein [Acidobacteriota bacterium]MCW5966990.1 hypothetical protein [Blastocatellales bacterium]
MHRNITNRKDRIWQSGILLALLSSLLLSSMARLREGKFAFISSSVIELPEPVLGFKRSFLVRDPDAHAMQLIER